MIPPTIMRLALGVAIGMTACVSANPQFLSEVAPDLAVDPADLNYAEIDLNHAAIDLGHHVDMNPAEIDLSVDHLDMNHAAMDMSVVAPPDLHHAALDMNHALIDMSHASPDLHHPAIDMSHAAIDMSHAPPDLSHAIVDMSHAPPDLAVAVACSRELLKNGNFDDTITGSSGHPEPTFWLVPDDQVIYRAPIEGVNGAYTPYSAPYSLKLGGASPGTLSIEQGVSIPAGTIDLRFTGQLLVGGYPIPSWTDHLDILFSGAGGTDRQTVPLATSADVGTTWHPFSVTVIPPSTANGWQVSLQSTIVANGLGTDFMLDDVALWADLPAAYCH